VGILSKLLSRIPPPEGIRLDIRYPFWELSGETDFSSLLLALPQLLPQGCVLYFEGGSPSADLLKFLQSQLVPERAHVARGTIWPKPRVFHLSAALETMTHLADLMHSRVYPKLAIHFHVYRDQTVLLEWHDAFTQPMLISGDLPEDLVRAFATQLQMSFTKGNV
jgi:hypothetical protein